MTMSTDADDRAVWDSVYDRWSPEELPWFGVTFPVDLAEAHSMVGKLSRVLVTGCGAGDVVAQLFDAGYRNVIGADLSAKGIAHARRRFGDRCFVVGSTEGLAASGWHVDVVLDWLVLHHITPERLIAYLSALACLGDTVLVGWLCGDVEQTVPSSVKPDGVVYWHALERVLSAMPRHAVRMSHRFDIAINPAFAGLAIHQGGVLLGLQRV
jgi:SAM-dependent methyltransferase